MGKILERKFEKSGFRQVVFAGTRRAKDDRTVGLVAQTKPFGGGTPRRKKKEGGTIIERNET